MYRSCQGCGTVFSLRAVAIFERERQARRRDEADLAWLNDEWVLAPGLP
jgi:hypothetical protein